jgi:hypothetical protein
MKRLVVAMVLMGSISAFSQDRFTQQNSKTPFCKHTGQSKINQQIRLVQTGIENGDIDAELEFFFFEGIKTMQENFDFICLGVPLSSGQNISAREAQLNTIKKGIASGEIDADLAEYFLENLKI